MGHPFRTPAPGPSPDDEEDEIQLEGEALRDYILARSAVALSALDSAKTGILDAVAMFVSPSDDRKGRTRARLLNEAIESSAIATRALEDAMEALNVADEPVVKVAAEAIEPWEEDDDDEETAS